MKEYVSGVITFIIITYASLITEWISLSLRNPLEFVKFYPFHLTRVKPTMA